MNAAVDQFRAACEAAGLIPGEIIPDGQRHRCGTQGAERGKDGAYRFYPDAPPSGWYQNHRRGGPMKWTSGNGKPPSPAEAEAYQRRKAAHEEEERQIHAEASAKASKAWDAAQPCTEHPYLARKQVQPHGVRQGKDGRVIVPVLDENDAVMSLQFIDADGGKLFLAGGKTAGGYYPIGDDQDGKLFYIAEGFATSASIHEATGATVLVAFGCGNLPAVAQVARAKYPGRAIVIAADTDPKGMSKAIEAARAVNAKLAVPVFADPEGKSDFNDLAVAEGPDAVRRCLADAQEPEPPKEEQAAPPPARGLSLVRASDVKSESVNWIAGLPRGSIVIGEGQPGVSKTMYACKIAAHISTGTPWIDGQSTEPADCIIVNLEDSLGCTLRPRLEAAGADLDRVHLFNDAAVDPDDPDAATFTLPKDLDRLEASIVQHKAKFVCLDPIMACLDSKVNSYRDQDIRRVLAPLKAICGKTGCAMLLLRHLNKAPGGPAIHRGGGSIGIIGAARMGLLMAVDPDDDNARILCVVKNNLAAFDPKQSTRWNLLDGPRLEYAGTTNVSADQLLAELDEKKPRGRPEKKGDAAAWAQTILAEGPMESNLFYTNASLNGFNEKTMRRACNGITKSFRKGDSWHIRLHEPYIEPKPAPPRWLIEGN